MVTFIPEWIKVSGRAIHIKKALNALDDTCVVRRPIRPTKSTPELFVQHPDKGWLAIVVCDAPFSAIDPGQMFETAEQTEFVQTLANFSNLAGIPPSINKSLGKLVVMWSCLPEEVTTLSKQYFERFGLRLLSREQFSQHGDKLIPRLFGQLDEVEAQLLLGSFFPEAEIPAVCTTRRHFNRDNSAKLTRFFLDSQQEWASKLDLELPQEQMEAVKDLSVRLINGVAGSGKTLIAINRALMLADIFPSQRILILIHNTPVVADIKEKIYRSRGGIPSNLEINTFSSWAHQQWRNVFQARLEMPGIPVVPALIKHNRASWPDLKQTEEQLQEEFDFINDSLIISVEHCINTSRSGRGFALRKTEREQIWALYEAVTSTLNSCGQRMWSAFPREICLSNENRRLQKYNHILIDEAQFFAPSWFQVVKLTVESDGHLFLCADPNQGFMKNRLSWKSVGLDVAGRTKKLRKSYRTTQAILEAASRALAQFVQGDPEDYLEPDFTGMEPGTPPFLIYVDTPQDAVDRVTNELTAIIDEGQLPLASLLVIYGDNIQKKLLYELLEKRVGHRKVWWLNKSEHKKEPPSGYGKDYLRMANLDTATGLEASVVFLVGVDSLLSESGIPGQSKDELDARAEENGRKLYMAMTRAGQRLVMVAAQKLPASIENLFQINSESK